MIIEHKFINHLYPDWNIKYLFIGTFNPAIENPKFPKNNIIDYFYGRPRNKFWNILPLLFNEDSLKEASFQKKMDFLKSQQIGITDIIEKIDISNYDEKEATKILLTYADSSLNMFFNDITFTRIEDIINKNSSTLKVIILTRQHPNSVKFIREKWNSLSQLCFKYNIKVKELQSPSGRGLKCFGKPINDVLFQNWYDALTNIL